MSNCVITTNFQTNPIPFGFDKHVKLYKYRLFTKVKGQPFCPKINNLQESDYELKFLN